MHFIKRSDILELIKKSIQRASKYTITNEEQFREQILAELSVRQEVDDTENEEKIVHAEERMKELDTLIGRLRLDVHILKYLLRDSKDIKVK